MSIEQRLSAGLRSFSNATDSAAQFVDQYGFPIKIADLAQKSLKEVYIEVRPAPDKRRAFRALDIANPRSDEGHDPIYDCAVLALETPLKALQAQQTGEPSSAPEGPSRKRRRRDDTQI
jgi:hypothetical protein